MAYATTLDAHVIVGVWVTIGAHHAFWIRLNGTLTSDWIAGCILEAIRTQVGAVHARTFVNDSPLAKPLITLPIVGYLRCAGAQCPHGLVLKDTCPSDGMASALRLQAWILCAALYIISHTPVYPSSTHAVVANVVMRVKKSVRAIHTIIPECVVAITSALLASAISLAGVGERAGDILHEAHVGFAPLVLAT